MRCPTCEAVSFTGNINPAVQNLATTMDGALDRAVVQKRRIICTWQLPRHPLDTADFQSHGKVHWIHVHYHHFPSCMRRSQSICVPEGSRGTRRIGFHGADMDFWIQRKGEVRTVLQ